MGDAPKFLLPKLFQANIPNESSVRLHITHKEDVGICYCTLSHCPVGAIDIMTPKSHNISILQASIKIQDLPETFRDAIQITGQLRVGFFWIDSLCIIQDSIEDWGKEAAKMGSIYETELLIPYLVFLLHAHAIIYTRL